MDKRTAQLLAGPLLFAAVLLLLREPFGFRGAAAMATAVGMAAGWICRPVSIAVTSLLPIVLNALFNLIPNSVVISKYFSDIVVLLLGSDLICMTWTLTGLDRRVSVRALCAIGPSMHQQILVWLLASAALSIFLPNVVVAEIFCPIAVGMLKFVDMWNRPDDHVKLIFLPCYLTGDDGVFNMSYYDLILGNDLCIYPSYYEPWGYTPLEAVAFKVPCITTDLAGFGQWANSEHGGVSEIIDGVKVIHRTDYNYSEVADNIKDTVSEFSAFTKEQVAKARANADKLSKKALWSHFIKYYYEAYDIALRKASQRISEHN